MAIPDPAVSYFQYFGAGGATEIALEQEIESDDWEAVNTNDVYQWAEGNLRAFWSWGDADEPLKQLQSSLVFETITEGFWHLSEGRSAITVGWDAEDCTILVTLYDLAGVPLLALSTSPVSRAQGTLTFSGLSAGTEGYFVIEAKPRVILVVTTKIYGIYASESGIAQADL